MMKILILTGNVYRERKLNKLKLCHHERYIKENNIKLDVNLKKKDKIFQIEAHIAKTNSSSSLYEQEN